MKSITLIVLVGFVFIAKMSFSESFDIAKNKWSLGGDASFSIKTNFDGRTNLDLGIKPSASYLAFKRWEFGFQPIMNFTILRQVPVANRVEWGAFLYSRRYFEIRDNIYYYTGIRAGGRMFDLDMQTWKIAAGIDNGLLIGLSSAIALDIGVPITAHFSHNIKFDHIEIPVGYLGVKAFF